MSDTDKAIISESYINILQHRVEELEAELAGQSAELGAAKRKIAELEVE